MGIFVIYRVLESGSKFLNCVSSNQSQDDIKLDLIKSPENKEVVVYEIIPDCKWSYNSIDDLISRFRFWDLEERNNVKKCMENFGMIELRNG